MQLVGALEHDLFFCPFVTHFGFCPLSLDLGPLALFLPFPSFLSALFTGVCQGFIIHAFQQFEAHSSTTALQQLLVAFCFQLLKLSISKGLHNMHTSDLEELNLWVFSHIVNVIPLQQDLQMFVTKKGHVTET